MIANCCSPTYFFECCCNNHNDKFWGISIDAIFTSLITIGIFIFGFWLNKKNDQRKEFDSLMDIKIYFLQLIQILIDSTEKQIKAFEDFVVILKEKKQQPPTINNSSNFTTKYVNEIPNEKLFKIFVSYKPTAEKEKAISLFKEIILSIGLIKRIEKDWEVYFKDFNVREFKLYDEYKEFATQIRYFTDRMIHSVSSSTIPKTDKFIEQFFLIENKWRKMDNSFDIYVRAENLISPLFVLCQNMPDDPKAQELLKSLRGSQHIFMSIETLRKDYIDLFSHYNKRLKEAIDQIQNSVAELEKLKDINPWIF